jgi:hypothetical protein
LFDVEHLIVVKAVLNSAPEGQPLAVEEIWGDNVTLAYVDRSEDQEALSFGRTFVWSVPESELSESETETLSDEAKTGVRATSYMTNDQVSLVVRAEQNTDEKLCAPKAGYVLEDVLL